MTNLIQGLVAGLVFIASSLAPQLAAASATWDQLVPRAELAADGQAGAQFIQLLDTRFPRWEIVVVPAGGNVPAELARRIGGNLTDHDRQAFMLVNRRQGRPFCQGVPCEGEEYFFPVETQRQGNTYVMSTSLQVAPASTIPGVVYGSTQRTSVQPAPAAQQPVYTASTVTYGTGAPAPAPTYQPAAPAPVYQAPAPAPVYQAPDQSYVAAPAQPVQTYAPAPAATPQLSRQLVERAEAVANRLDTSISVGDSTIRGLSTANARAQQTLSDVRSAEQQLIGRWRGIAAVQR